jgi:hypothetical protein
MTTATINDSASGAWRVAHGLEVELLETKTNGRASLIQMPTDSFKRGRPCWLPTSWLNVKEPEPALCPCCGRPLEDQPC